MKRFAIELTITVIAALLFSGIYALAEATPLVGEEVSANEEAISSDVAVQAKQIRAKLLHMRYRLALQDKKLRKIRKQVEFLEKMYVEPPQPKYSVTPEERELMVQIVYLEANTESAEGQQAVAEVILNRRDNGRFPDTIREVIFAPGQFTSAGYLEWAKTNADNYAAVDAALMGDAPILEPDVVFFSQQGENDRVYAKIGNHVFCREYIW